MDFATTSMAHESTGVSTFFVERGYELRMSFDWQAARNPQQLQIKRRQVHELAEQIEEI
jgi:hypothetical protein